MIQSILWLAGNRGLASSQNSIHCREEKVLRRLKPSKNRREKALLKYNGLRNDANVEIVMEIDDPLGEILINLSPSLIVWNQSTDETTGDDKCDDHRH